MDPYRFFCDHYCSSHKMGCSPNYGPLFVIGSITVPNIQGYQNGTLILGTTQILTKRYYLVAISYSIPPSVWTSRREA